MRTNSKLKKILDEHTVGLSYSDIWEMTTINLKTGERRHFNGKTFSEMIGKAFIDHGKHRKNSKRVPITRNRSAQ